MGIIQLGISVLLISALVGCVPNATVYYRPTVDVDSVHEEAHCVPMEKYVHFNIILKGQTLKVRGYGNTYSSSEGTEGQFVIYGEWHEIKYKDSGFYLVVPGSDVKINPIKTYGEVNKHEGYLMFNSGVVFPKQSSESFDIIFPPLIIDGEEVELPILHVKRTVWVGISPFNC